MSCIKISVCCFIFFSVAISAFAAGDQNYKDLYRQGVEYNKKGDLDKAIEFYSKAIALKPDSAALFFVRGRAYNSKEQHDRAIADLTKAIALKPDDAEAYNIRGISYSMKKQDKLANADFRKACSQGLKDACKNVK